MPRPYLLSRPRTESAGGAHWGPPPRRPSLRAPAPGPGAGRPSGWKRTCLVSVVDVGRWDSLGQERQDVAAFGHLPAAFRPPEGEGPAAGWSAPWPPGSRAGVWVWAKAAGLGLPFGVAAAACDPPDPQPHCAGRRCLPKLPLPHLSLEWREKPTLMFGQTYRSAL